MNVSSKYYFFTDEISSGPSFVFPLLCPRLNKLDKRLAGDRGKVLKTVYLIIFNQLDTNYRVKHYQTVRPFELIFIKIPRFMI